MNFHTMHLLYSYHKEFSRKKNREKNLSDTESMICSFILSHKDCSQDDVVSALRADKTTVAKALYNLEEKGCLVRTQDAVDRRIKRLSLTSLGSDTISELKDMHEHWLQSITSCLTPEEKLSFETIGQKLL